MSPMLARPENVSALPPMVTPRRVISESPRLINAARVLSPAPSYWYQEGPGRRFLFLLAKMNQDLVDNFLVFDAGDDSGRATAATANFNVDIEYSLESLVIVHLEVSFSR